jgi:uncharacterized OB-fold protein
VTEAQLVGFHCGSCGATTYPRVIRCPSCSAEAGEGVVLPTSGEIVEATRMHVSLPDVEAPYVVSFVRLDGGVAVYCRLRGIKQGAELPSPGTRVELIGGEDESWWAEVVS